VKFLVFILASYLLTLAIMPCPDTDNCSHQETHTGVADTDDHSEHDGEDGICSPFCSCACSGQTCGFEFTQLGMALNIPISSGKIAIDPSSFFLDVYRSIWLPPKIS